MQHDPFPQLNSPRSGPRPRVSLKTLNGLQTIPDPAAALRRRSPWMLERLSTRGKHPAFTSLSSGGPSHQISCCILGRLIGKEWPPLPRQLGSWGVSVLALPASFRGDSTPDVAAAAHEV